MGELVWLRPRYDRSDGPSSLVAKFPSPDPEVRAGMNADRLYEREARFYQEVGSRAPRSWEAIDYAIDVPLCYHKSHR